MAVKSEQERRQSRAASRKRRRKQNVWVISVLAVLAVGIIVALALWIGSGFGSGDDPSSPAKRSEARTEESSAAPESSDASLPAQPGDPTGPSQSSVVPAPNAQYTDDGHYVQPEGGDWKLLLVNGWNPMTEAEANAVPLAAYNESWDFDERALPALNQMLEDANANGCNLWGQSLFRAYDLQKALYEDQVYELLMQGRGQQEAEDEAATIVARPGCSEHNTGLAVDLECADFADLDEGFKDTFDYEWLQAHCAEYGFILRFPKEKEEITGVIYEPWHYRYVGVEAATEIMSRGLCLEEYLEEKGL